MLQEPTSCPGRPPGCIKLLLSSPGPRHRAHCRASVLAPSACHLAISLPPKSISKNTGLCQTGQQGALASKPAKSERPSSEPDAAFVHLSSKKTNRDGRRTCSDFCRERLMLLALQIGAERDHASGRCAIRGRAGRQPVL